MKEHHPVCPPDQVGRGNIAHPTSQLRDTAVSGVVAVVTDEEEMPLRNRVDRCFILTAVRVVGRVQHGVAAAFRVVSMYLSFRQTAPSPTGALLHCGRRPALPWGSMISSKLPLRSKGRAVPLMCRRPSFMHRVTGQANHALDEVRSIHRMPEHHHIAALRIFAKPTVLDEGAGGERAGVLAIAVGHLIDEQKVGSARCPSRNRRDQ